MGIGREGNRIPRIFPKKNIYGKYSNVDTIEEGSGVLSVSLFSDGDPLLNICLTPAPTTIFRREIEISESHVHFPATVLPPSVHRDPLPKHRYVRFFTG
jgi:hypothetical protein